MEEYVLEAKVIMHRIPEHTLHSTERDVALVNRNATLVGVVCEFS